MTGTGPYGWNSFDSDVVSHRGLRCPFVGHEHDALRWKVYTERKKSTEPHGSPPIMFRTTPTFIYDDPLQNFIVGHALVRDAIAGPWGKAETWRLGYENSEDALSWNFFRSVQEARRLELIASVLCDTQIRTECELYLWGRRIDTVATHEWTKLKEVREQLEPSPTFGMSRQQTEPDIVLHTDGWGWIFIEAKLGSKIASYTTDRVEEWIQRYSAPCPGVFAESAMRKMKHQEFPQQLLRNVAFAARMRESGERALVVALVRESSKTDIEAVIAQCLAADGAIVFRQVAWEALYRALPMEEPLGALRQYFQVKSLGLRRAFALH